MTYTERSRIECPICAGTADMRYCPGTGRASIDCPSCGYHEEFESEGSS